MSLTGKQICARMDISGEISGKSCLLIGIKDAIRLGGTLIMLPTAELKEVVGREEYSDEIEDSYGEIANIIAGSFTKDFEESYTKTCRFVRKEQEVLAPAKIDIAADSPIADGMYYQIDSSMALEGQQMGKLVMLLPAATFELHRTEKPTEPTSQASAAAGPEPNTLPKAFYQKAQRNSREKQLLTILCHLQHKPTANPRQSVKMPKILRPGKSTRTSKNGRRE